MAASMLKVVDVVDVFRGDWAKAEDLTPSPGDIIDFNRGTYTHHGVSVGNGLLVHKTASESAPVCQAYIRLESLQEVAGSSDVRINNHKVGATMRGLSARSPDVIVQSARREVEKQEPYTVWEQNCEEFATRMRYGKGWSSQAIAGKLAAALGIQSARTSANMISGSI